MKIFNNKNLTNQSIITFVEKGSNSPAKISLKTNNISFYKEKIDDGKDNINKKCDYLLIKKEQDIWMFIELKGTKIADAEKQIDNTYNNLKDTCKDKIRYIAISGRIQLPSIKIDILKEKYIKQGFKKPFIKSGKIELEYIVNEQKIIQVN